MNMIVLVYPEHILVLTIDLSLYLSVQCHRPMFFKVLVFELLTVLKLCQNVNYLTSIKYSVQLKFFFS